MQSTLDPAGTGAEQIAVLWWWMLAGALLIWFAVVGLAWYAGRLHPERHSARGAWWLIVAGGGIFPTVVLAALLVYGLALMPGLLAPGEPGLLVRVSGEEWWWRVRYEVDGAAPVELANEVRLPVGRRTEFSLGSPDVIHSFWIPALGGKIDMIPGRTTRLALEPTRTGTFRGTCAEYCGASHAFMSFVVVVMEPAAFDAWLAAQRQPAVGPASVAGRAGREAFLANGCPACHTVRGTPADGVVGPDLTHVGGRSRLAAGVLPNDAASLRRWIRAAPALKPDVHMPAFGMLPAAEVDAIAAWLETLQ